MLFISFELLLQLFLFWYEIISCCYEFSQCISYNFRFYFSNPLLRRRSWLLFSPNVVTQQKNKGPQAAKMTVIVRMMRVSQHHTAWQESLWGALSQVRGAETVPTRKKMVMIVTKPVTTAMKTSFGRVKD